MSLFRQKGRRTWQARVWSPNLRRVVSVSTMTDDRLKAEEVELRLRQAASGAMPRNKATRALDKLLGPDKSRVSFEDAWASYENSSPGISRNQMGVTRGCWSDMAGWMRANGASCVGDVTRSHAYRYYDHLLATCKSKTAKNKKGCVSAVVSAIADRIGLESNPFAGIKSVDKDDSEKGRAFTDAEMDRLIEAASGDWRGVVLCGRYTGLRFSDAALLEWDDIKDGVIVTVPGKTRKRKIEVSIPVHAKLEEWLSKRGRGSAYLFPDIAKRYKQIARTSEFTSILKAAKIEARYGEYVGFHSLRHTFRTALAAAGVDTKVAQRLGGWTTDISEKIYNHDVESLRSAIDKLK